LNCFFFKLAGIVRHTCLNAS